MRGGRRVGSTLTGLLVCASHEREGRTGSEHLSKSSEPRCGRCAVLPDRSAAFREDAKAWFCLSRKRTIPAQPVHVARLRRVMFRANRQLRHTGCSQ